MPVFLLRRAECAILSQVSVVESCDVAQNNPSPHAAVGDDIEMEACGDVGQLRRSMAELDDAVRIMLLKNKAGGSRQRGRKQASAQPYWVDAGSA